MPVLLMVKRHLRAGGRELSDAAGMGLATATYGVSFGAVAVAAGLNVAQASALSLLMFTGASQFAFAAGIGAGGGVASAVLTAGLLGARNAFYGIQMQQRLGAMGVRRFAAAHLTIDETVAMALAREEPARARRAFWLTGAAIFLCWNVGTLVGAVAATGIENPRAYGLDAAAPASFLALLWPRLRRPLRTNESARMVSGELPWLAAASAALAVVATPLTPEGAPVLLAALLAIAWGWSQIRRSRLRSAKAGLPGAEMGGDTPGAETKRQ